MALVGFAVWAADVLGGLLDRKVPLDERQRGAALARGRFEGWPQWGRAFLDGRVLWGGEARSYYETVVDKLLKDPKSAWNRFSWQEATSG